MKATITTKLATTICGEVTFIGSQIIAIDLNELPATKALELADADVSMTKYCTCWHVQIPRRIIDTMSIED